MKQTIADWLVQLGGRRWTKAGKDRVYIPENLGLSLIGVRISRYNSGNIAAATRKGEKISNSLARDYVAQVEGAYYDVSTDRFHGCAEVAKALRAKLAEGATREEAADEHR